VTTADLTTADIDGRVGAIAALADPRRRAMYQFVVAQDRAVSRDEAADALGVSRSVAAFHLDRMVDEGLLDTEFRRLGSRQGPGAGRPSKLYRRAAGEIAVSLPARQYDLAADLLASAVTEAAAGGTPVGDALRRLAREHGAALAGTVSGPGGAGEAARALVEHGYEPRVGDGAIVLANCPFHALAARHAELVCGMNLALLEGFADALSGGGWAAHLHPTGNGCCVRLERGP
jgi:predicted ArsR family transcriptional regulator